MSNPSSPSAGLRRSIGLLDGVSIIVGSIIGSGVFVSPGGVLLHVGGSPIYAVLVWAASGVICTIGALCFSELGTRYKDAGGEYAYTYEAFGPLPAFVTLWVNVMLIRPAAQAVVALACAEYSVALLFMDGCSAAPRTAVIFIAAAVLGLLTAVNCHSVHLSMTIQKVFTAGKLVALAVIILAGLLSMVTKGMGDLLSSPTDLSDGSITIGGLALSFYSGLFAYGGWNYLNFATEELKDPERNLPLAIWIGLPLVTAVYVLVNIAYLVVLPAHLVATSPAVAVEFGRAVFPPLQYVMPIFVALSTFGSLNGILFTSGRLFYAASLKRQMPPILSYISLDEGSKFSSDQVNRSTPTPALITSCALSFCLLGLDIISLINCLSFVLWLSIGTAVAALIKFKFSKNSCVAPPNGVNVPRILPVVFLVFCVYLVLVPMVTNLYSTLLGVLMTLTSLLVYPAGMRCARIDAVRRANGAVTRFTQKLLCVVPPPKKPCLLHNECVQEHIPFISTNDMTDAIHDSAARRG